MGPRSRDFMPKGGSYGAKSGKKGAFSPHLSYLSLLNEAAGMQNSHHRLTSDLGSGGAKANLLSTYRGGGGKCFEVCALPKRLGF